MKFKQMNCERCGEITKSRSMSKFNTDFICPECEDREKAHPLYAEADRVEIEQVRKGNYNFPGIGLPADLRIQRFKTETGENQK